MKLILASKSPRRREILKNAGYKFEIREINADESVPAETRAVDVPLLISKIKANAVKINADEVVLTADTVVISNEKALGKPKDKKDAVRMLRELSGKTHLVATGITIKSSCKEKSFTAITKVSFFKLSDEEIELYASSEEPYDKAGAYGIQGKAALFVEKINGDYFNVVGLPVSKVYRALSIFNIIPEI